MPGGKSIGKEAETSLLQTGNLHCSRNETLKLLFLFGLPHSRLREYSREDIRLFKNHERTTDYCSSEQNTRHFLPKEETLSSLGKTGFKLCKINGM